MTLLPGWLLPDGFAWPWWLLAIPLPLLARVLLPPRRQGAAALRVPWGERLQRIAATAGAAAPRVRGLSWLALLAWTLLCVAAARPQQLGPPVAPPQAGRDLMLAIDLSASMGEVDMELGGRPVDRLTAAKAVLADFLDRRAGDRIGLVVFGDRAYALTPLTADLASVREQLEASELGLAGRATALGDAIGLAIKRLQGAGGSASGKDHVLILLTDGVNTAGLLDPLRAARIAADAGVRIHAIAVGGRGGALSLFGFQLPGGGDGVDEAGLRRIAEATGGRFFRARATAELAGIYAEIERLEPVQRQGRPLRPTLERYPFPLGAALVLALMVAWRRR